MMMVNYRWDFSPGDIKLLRQLRQRLSYSREIKKCQLSQHLGLTVTEFIFQVRRNIREILHPLEIIDPLIRNFIR